MPEELIVRHFELCECRNSYDVQCVLEGTNYLAYCVDCGIFRGSLDKGRYGKALGLTPIGGQQLKTSIFDQSHGQQKITQMIAGGTCVHCTLASSGKINRRPVFPIPRVWKDLPVYVQAPLFATISTEVDPPTISLRELATTDRDHIFQRRLHGPIEHHLASSQNVLVRRHWIVPSCTKHNSMRANVLEGLPYLMHLFALYLAAKNLTIADAAEEAQLFVDTAKTVHTLLRVQAVAAQKEA